MARRRYSISSCWDWAVVSWRRRTMTKMQQAEEAKKSSQYDPFSSEMQALLQTMLDRNGAIRLHRLRASTSPILPVAKIVPLPVISSNRTPVLSKPGEEKHSRDEHLGNP